MRADQTRLMFSSASGEWTTPRGLFDALDEEFHFTLDAAATRDNALCPTLARDGLQDHWTGRVWCNPPYSRSLGEWVERAYLYTSTGLCDLAVLLVPARTDTKWWHQWAMAAQEIRFIRGRLKFGGQSNGAPFPSCLLIYRKDATP